MPTILSASKSDWDTWLTLYQEFEQQLAYESDSDEVVDLKPSDITKNFKAASSPHQPLGTRREVQDGSQQDLQQVSPVPLIVSDIVRRTAPVKRTALPTHKPTQSKEKAEDKGRKRAGDPERQDQGVWHRQIFLRHPTSHVLKGAIFELTSNCV